MTSEPEFTFGAEHVHADHWCAACIEEGHRRARLSHDRGADAEWDDFRHDLINERFMSFQEAFDHHRPLIEAALRSVPAPTDDDLAAEYERGWNAANAIAARSVPAPTLPALDAETLAEAIHEYGGVCISRYSRKTCIGSDHRIMADAILEALRDAV